MNENDISKFIVDAAFAVHKSLGPGLLENAYKVCMAYELSKNLEVETEYPMPLVYEEIQMDCGYRFDIWVERKVIVEIKAVKELNDLHMAQIISYLRLSNCKLGLLINFHVPLIKDGIKRVANGM
jgi:GxxExxY protein